VQLIDDEGKMLGVMSTTEAWHLAQERGYDLVEVNPTAKPPIAKLLDFGQFQYKQQKLAQAQKVKAKKIETKGIRLSLKIGDHDRDVRLKQANKFLAEGHKVRIEVILKGREKAHVPLAQEQMLEFVKLLGEGVNIEVPFSRMGGRLSLQVGKKAEVKAKSEEKIKENI